MLISPMACAGYLQQSDCDYFLEMNMNPPKDAIIKYDEKNKTVIQLKGNNLSADLENDENFKLLQSTDKYSDIALAFICAHHSLFQLNAPSEELSVASRQTDDLGFTHIKFQQVYKGIPVWASEINLHLNQQDHVYLVQGRYIPTPDKINTQPAVSEKEATDAVAEKLGKAKSGCPGCRSEIIVFADAGMQPCLAYRIEASPGLTEGWEFIVDATSGEVLKKLPAVFNRKTEAGRTAPAPME